MPDPNTSTEGYQLTEDDARGLMLIRRNAAMLADFAEQIGVTSHGNLAASVTWLDSFCDRIGVTALAARVMAADNGYTIDTESQLEDRP